MAERLSAKLYNLLDKPNSRAYVHHDLRQFLAILLAHRILRSKNSPLCLDRVALGRAVSKLLGQDPLPLQGATEIIHLELLLRVLAEALLSLSKETFTLSHKVGEVWCAAIKHFDEVYGRIVEQKPVGLDVECWSVAF